MEDIEKMVWAAAFAAAHSREWDFVRRGNGSVSVDDITGYKCAEEADHCLEKFREAVVCEDREYITPVKDGWVA